MFISKKLIFLASLFMVGVILLAACGAEESTPTPVEEAIDTQATVEAAEAEEAAQATVEAAETEEAELAEAAIIATDTASSSESQVPSTSSEVPRISREELKERLDVGEEIVIVDTRWRDPYDLEHIAGAILPADSPLEEFPHDQEIVIYCT